MEDLVYILIFALIGLSGAWLLLGVVDEDDLVEDCWEEEEAESVKRSMELMDNDERKEVYFDKYCHMCVACDKKEDEEPCCDCLEEPVNLYSHKPVKFKSKLDDDYTWPEDVK